jgi:anthranilate 1,2-dioxygenase small subunit/terephthalate 1,2-dioxygenase oxygenase component beta subunit
MSDDAVSDDAASEAGRLFRLAALNTEYASCIDADRLEEWPGLFLEDGRYRITTADNHRRGYAAGLIYADSRAMLHDRVSSLREANIYERQTYRHIVGMPALRGATAGDIAAETPFVVVRTMRDGRMDLFAAGVYLDRVRADADGRLRFAERLVVCDSSRIDTLLAIPL